MKTITKSLMSPWPSSLCSTCLWLVSGNIIVNIYFLLFSYFLQTLYLYNKVWHWFLYIESLYVWNLILTYIWDTFGFILKFRCDNHHDGIHAITRRSHTNLSSLTHELQSPWLPHTHIYICPRLSRQQLSKHYISHFSLTLLPLWAPYSYVVKSWPNKSH